MKEKEKMTSTTTTRNAFAKLSGQIGGTGPPNFEYLIHDLPNVLGNRCVFLFLSFPFLAKLLKSSYISSAMGFHFSILMMLLFVWFVFGLVF